MSRQVEIEKKVLSKNDARAEVLRERFREAGVKAINLVSGPGAGKTALLERTLSELVAQGRKVAALVGDLETDRDAQRLARSGALVRQIKTNGMCHLEAHMIESHLEGWQLDQLDLLFLENVGNLVCPIGFDLGESLRVVLFSTPEGEDKPLKYPATFLWADLVLLTKIDLVGATEFDLQFALQNIDFVHRGVPVLGTSARTGQGISSWIEALP